MIGVVDYGRGNLFSIGQALHHLGHEVELVSDPDRLLKLERAILPGVGAFGDAMQSLRATGMDDALREFTASGRLLMGICLGMQLFADESEEFGRHRGLGLVRGQVQMLPAGEDRIPNVGWRRLSIPPQNRTIEGFEGRYFYFVHSFQLVCRDDADIAGSTGFNGTLSTAVLWRDNVRATQFHPEKSGPVGLQLLARMLEP